jgi:selenide, water dikinase
VLGDLPFEKDGRVLVDYRTGDDAGVYKISDDRALVQTVDFFTPIVDDPFLYGQIAAANALSDIYAMGGRPLTALAVAGFPTEVDRGIIKAIFSGGVEMLRTAEVALLGGHTVQDPEIKFGYSVTGAVDPDRILTNASARVGDTLVLTKPLGTGIVVRARKYGQGTDDHLAAAVASMKQLNDEAAIAIRALPRGSVSACTDVTGFGLAGHGTEMARGSGVTLVIQADALPVLPGALDLAREFLPCGGRSNLKFFTGFRAEASVPLERQLICLDPQTSGGLLVAMAPDAASVLIRTLADRGVSASAIGHVERASHDSPLWVRLT